MKKHLNEDTGIGLYKFDFSCPKDVIVYGDLYADLCRAFGPESVDMIEGIDYTGYESTYPDVYQSAIAYSHDEDENAIAEDVKDILANYDAVIEGEDWDTLEESLNEDNLNPAMRKDAKIQYKRYQGRRDRKKSDYDELLNFEKEYIKSGKRAFDGSQSTSDDIKGYKNLKDKYKKKMDAWDEEHPFNLNKYGGIEREDYPYYVTLYEKTAAYEPAEGGYYVEERYASSSNGFNTYDSAVRFMDAYMEGSGEYWEPCGKDCYEWSTKYIGEGQIIRIETNKNYLEGEKHYNGYESFNKNKYKSNKKPSKMNESRNTSLEEIKEYFDSLSDSRNLPDYSYWSLKELTGYYTKLIRMLKECKRRVKEINAQVDEEGTRDIAFSIADALASHYYNYDYYDFVDQFDTFGDAVNNVYDNFDEGTIQACIDDLNDEIEDIKSDPAYGGKPFPARPLRTKRSDYADWKKFTKFEESVNESLNESDNGERLGRWLGARLMTKWTAMLNVVGAEESPEYEFEESFDGNFVQCVKKLKEYQEIIDKNNLDAYLELESWNSSGSFTGDYDQIIDELYYRGYIYDDDFEDNDIDESLNEDTIKRYSDVVPKKDRKYWYFTTHGVGPGSIPKGINVLKVVEGKNDKGTLGDYVLLDAVLNTDELKEYDLRELAPKYGISKNESLDEGWQDYLSSDVYNRLANCTTTKDDLRELVNAKWASYKEQGKDKKGFTKEDALVSVLELLDSNGIDTDMTIDDYNDLKESLNENWDSLVYKVAESAIKFLDKNRQYVELVNYDQMFNEFTIEVTGDWKHDLLRTKWLLEEEFEYDGIKVRMVDREDVGETDSDWGTEDQTYRLVETSKLTNKPREMSAEVKARLVPKNDGNGTMVDPNSGREYIEYVPLGEAVGRKFTNGTLSDWEPQDLMQKVIETGQSMNTIRTNGDNTYLIDIFYEEWFGPKGIDNPDEKYWVDIVKEGPDGKQERVLSERNLLSNEVVNLLDRWIEKEVYGVKESAKVDIKASLNEMDKNSNNTYDLLNLYESRNFTKEQKKDIARMIYEKYDMERIYNYLYEADEESSDEVKSVEDRVKELTNDFKNTNGSYVFDNSTDANKAKNVLSQRNYEVSVDRQNGKFRVTANKKK